MSDKQPPSVDENFSSESLKLRGSLESCIRFGKYVDDQPLLKAILRHVASIPIREKRQQFMSTFQLESIRSQSPNYPYEANWYMDTILQDSEPNPDEISMHQDGFLDFRMTLFSYVNRDTGLLARYRFALLVDPDNKIEDYDRITSFFETVIMTFGGFATIETVPEVRWNCVNVVLGAPNPSWGKYCVKYYSINLITDAITTLKFDFKTRSRYRVLVSPGVALNFSNLSQLI